MASVYKRGNWWWIRYRDGHRQWRSEPCAATSKTEAKDLAIDVERRSERQRRNLEPIPPRDGGGSLGDLFRWWLETYAQPRTSYVRDTYTVTKHFLSAPIARLRLTEITPGVIERFLQSKAKTHGPQTLNHLRRYILTAFNCARRAERYVGPNPARMSSAGRFPSVSRTSCASTRCRGCSPPSTIAGDRSSRRPSTPGCGKASSSD